MADKGYAFGDRNVGQVIAFIEALGAETGNAVFDDYLFERIIMAQKTVISHCPRPADRHHTVIGQHIAGFVAASTGLDDAVDVDLPYTVSCGVFCCMAVRAADNGEVIAVPKAAIAYIICAAGKRDVGQCGATLKTMGLEVKFVPALGGGDECQRCTFIKATITDYDNIGSDGYFIDIFPTVKGLIINSPDPPIVSTPVSVSS